MNVQSRYLRILNAKILTDKGINVCDITSRDGKIISVVKSANADSNTTTSVNMTGLRRLEGKEQGIHHRNDYRLDTCEIYDAERHIVLPGLIDCHAHMFSLVFQDHIVDLRGSRSPKELGKRIIEFAQNFGRDRSARSSVTGDWIIGRGWDQDLFPGNRFPTSADLDDATGSKPALMIRVCGHIGLLNSEAVRRLSRELKRFDSKLLPQDPPGRPTGIVKEQALDFCWKSAYSPSEMALRQMFLRAQNLALRSGLVSVHCILSENWKAELAAIRSLESEGRIDLKTNLLLHINALEDLECMDIIERNRTIKDDSDRLCVTGFKLFADGSLGARTAALLEPYSDDRMGLGILYYDTKDIEDIARRVKSMKMILAVHAIGDAAILQVLNALRAAGIRARDGFRIEHCSVLNKRLLRSLKEVTISIQPSFATSDYWLEERLGRARISRRKAYAFRSLLHLHGDRVIAGSDSPVESIDPLCGIRSAVKSQVNGETLTIRDAIRIYTSNAAKASPLTKLSGKIAQKRNCDLVILDAFDISDVASSKVIDSFIDGKRVVFSSAHPSIVTSSKRY